MPRKALSHFGTLTLKHTKAGIPDPCITVRKNSGKELAGILFNPTGAFEVGVGTLIKGGKVKKKFTKKAPLKKYCLY